MKRCKGEKAEDNRQSWKYGLRQGRLNMARTPQISMRKPWAILALREKMAGTGQVIVSLCLVALQ